MCLTDIIQELQVDPWPVATAMRPLRATGPAVQLSIALLEVRLNRNRCERRTHINAGHVPEHWCAYHAIPRRPSDPGEQTRGFVLNSQLKAVQGPGQVTSDSLKDTIRTHHDIEKDTSNARFIKKSSRVCQSFPWYSLSQLPCSSMKGWPSKLLQTDTQLMCLHVPLTRQA